MPTNSLELCCGLAGKGFDPKPFNRKDDPYCLQRLFITLYLTIRYS